MDCAVFKSEVLSWFGGQMECRQESPDSLTAVLPIVKPNGDAIELGIRSLADNRWSISDLGDTHESLYLAGIDLSEESERTDEFLQIIGDHGISDEENELSVSVSGDLAEHVFDFVTAINSALALQFTMPTKQPSRDFSTIVAKFLAENHVSFQIPPGDIEGKTGKWRFNFSLNHVREETLVKTITATSATQAMTQAKKNVFEITDVVQYRANASALAIIDDEGERESMWKPRILRVFEGYNIPVIPFNTGRDRLTDLARRYAS